MSEVFAEETMETAGEESPALPYKGYIDTLPFPEIGAWREHAMCKDQGNLFFPSAKRGFSGEGSSVHKAKKEALGICKGCPVKFQCLRYAVKNDIKFGIWGGVDMQSLKGKKRTTLLKTFK